MNDEVKEILIELIDYYNIIGSKDDPGFEVFAAIVHRSSKALERHAKGTTQTAKDVDLFEPYDEFPDDIIKMEDEW